jgi:tetratricopeptide (TPR) repeat protein
MQKYNNQLESLISYKSNLDYHEKGIELHNKSEFDKAINCFHYAIAINSGYYRTHYSIGNSFLEKGCIETAIFYYARCIELKSDFFMGYKKMGEALVKQGRIDDALFCYREATKYNPKSPKRLIEIINRTCDTIALFCHSPKKELE